MTLRDLLTITDFITPLILVVENIINDPTPLHTNSWVFKCDISRVGDGYINMVLDEYGIKHFGGGVFNGQYTFSVPKWQARYAEYVLSGLGVELDPRSAGAPAPDQQANSRSFIDALRDTFGL